MQTSERIRQIHERALQVSSNHRKSEIELISILQEMDKCRGYLHFDANSLFDYSHRILQLSEATSMNLINVARKSVEVPELKQAIEQGVLSVSKARKIVPVLTAENQNAWITLATKTTSREIERAVAKENPQLSVRESARFVSEDRLELKLGLSDDNYQKLKRVCDLESQRTSKAVNQEAAITAAVEAYLEKYDPVRIAQRSLKRRTRAILEVSGSIEFSTAAKSRVGVMKTQSTNRKLTSGYTAKSAQVAKKISGPADTSERGDAKHVTGHVPNTAWHLPIQPASTKPRKSHLSKINPAAGSRPALSRTLVHQLNLRDGGQCAYQNSEDLRCTNRRWLEFHHIHPRSLGGTDTLENLKTLCSIHHNAIHRTRGTGATPP